MEQGGAIMWTTRPPQLFALILAVAFQAAMSACTSPTGTVKDSFDVTSSTTGRSWFTEDGIVRDDSKALAFTTLNFTVVKQNMAQGHGEYLASLATLLGIPADRQARFAALVQGRYPTLVRSDHSTPAQLVASLNGIKGTFLIIP
jgi:hypothetical protein